MRAESIMTAADRNAAERALRTGNAAAFLLTGGGRLATLIPHEWLLPNVPALMKYAFHDFRAEVTGSGLEILDSDFAKFIDVRTINDREFELKVNRIEAAANLVKLLYTVKFTANGIRGEMTDLAWEEIAEPLLVKLHQTDCRKNYTPDTRRLSFTLKIINVSNTDLPIRVGAELPEGWVLGDGNRLEFPLKGLNSVDLPLTIEFRGEKRSSQELSGKFLVNYTSDAWTQTEEEFTLIPRTSELRPVDPAAKTEPQFSNTRRNGCFAAILVGPDRKVSVDIEPISIGGNTSFVDYTLMDSGMHALKSGRLPFKDGKAAIEAEVPAPGVYFLYFNSRFSRFRFNGINHYGYLAEAGSTYHFNGNMEGAKTTLYFYVKPGAKSFEFAGQDGGVPEPGRITIFSPDGKKLYDRFGAYSAGKWYSVEVPRGSDGKVWKVEVYAVDDFDLMFRGEGVSRWLSLTPEAVITD
ncbi:hypothetical protein SDC9_121638 [bioreactor metagenome]|uniref:Uncharacterized protein n=1 Tax=bioreactor metagenome TaxID=1076179 RepID=A0A645CCI4_9ZZZZ